MSEHVEPFFGADLLDCMRGHVRSSILIAALHVLLQITPGFQMRGVGQLVEQLDECADSRIKGSVCAAVAATRSVSRRGHGCVYVIFRENVTRCEVWCAALCF